MSNSTQQLKAQNRREKFAELLRDMFQLDQPELDFGLYRIMHARKDDINRFIEQDLPRITQEAFANFASADKTQIEQELAKAIKQANDLGVNPDTLDKVQELKAKLADNFDVAREEGEVYDALVTFFNRYYDEGDFLSRRVYKDGTYAIPYQGEEVVLHWANKDQYYIKSSETLRDYSFRLNPEAGVGENPQRVHFKLVDADAGAKDNNKESDDSKRVFVLDAQTPFEMIEGEPDEQGERYPELQLRFYFKAATDNDWTETAKNKATAAAQKKPPTQDHLLSIAVDALLGEQSDLPDDWKTLLATPYKKADGELADYSMLQGQLNNYTKKNSFDYFIHKDLGGFLTRELDFYIKNELLDWADIVTLKNDPARLAPMLSKIEVVRSLGEKNIAFLAQLENFQKKLWLKKKFVTETNYGITLGRVPEHLYPDVCQNTAQLNEWVKLFAIDEIKGDLTNPAFSQPLTVEFLQSNQNLVLDTQFFDGEFKAKLIASIEDFDEQCDGLLIHSENFQALNLLQERYREQVKCIYIDPPYNAQSSEILYKNTFKHSSWMSLMQDRLQNSYHFLSDKAVLIVAIDEVENFNLGIMLQELFSSHDVATVSVVHNPTGQQGKNFSYTHEFAHFVYPKNIDVIGLEDRSDETREATPDIRPLRNVSSGTNHLRESGANCFYPIFIKDNRIIGFGDVCSDLFHPSGINEVLDDGAIAVYPIDPNGVESKWVFARDTVESILSELSVKYNSKDETYDIIREKNKFRYKSLWSDKRYSANSWGSAVLNKILPGNPFTYPKSIYNVQDCIDAGLSNSNSDFVLDYFAGSGTTGHAVINLNREDNGQRKYILTEMGNHFDAVLKPRLAKVAYASDWKNGKPVTRDTGISHCFKYIRLESYEDTLGNLALNTKQDLFANNDKAREAYLLNYMLDVETRGSQSLLNTQQFLEPTQYQLNVRSASGDETKAINVDLLETFNYLLGLTVEHIAAPMHFDAELSQGEFGRWQATVKHKKTGKWWFRTVYGTNPNGQKVLVVWRNLPSVIAGEKQGLQFDNAVLDAVLIEKLAIRLTESLDDEIDLMYVNGDHNIAIPRDRKGQPMEQARLQLIEEAFHRLMFANTESVQ